MAFGTYSRITALPPADQAEALVAIETWSPFSTPKVYETVSFATVTAAVTALPLVSVPGTCPPPGRTARSPARPGRGRWRRC